MNLDDFPPLDDDLHLQAKTPPSYGITYRDFVILLWLTEGSSGWESHGLAHASVAALTTRFRHLRPYRLRKEAIAAATAQAHRMIDRWYGEQGL